MSRKRELTRTVLRTVYLKDILNLQQPSFTCTHLNPYFQYLSVVYLALMTSQHLFILWNHYQGLRLLHRTGAFPSWHHVEIMTLTSLFFNLTLLYCRPVVMIGLHSYGYGVCVDSFFKLNLLPPYSLCLQGGKSKEWVEASVAKRVHQCEQIFAFKFGHTVTKALAQLTTKLLGALKHIAAL